MAKFKLQPNPTFKALVSLSVPGAAEPSQIEVEFRHLGKKAAEVYFREAAAKPDVQGIGGLIVGWEGVDAPYSTEALAQLLENYATAGIEIVDAYRRELFEAKLKN
jgi:hypothetical protein